MIRFKQAVQSNVTGPLGAGDALPVGSELMAQFFQVFSEPRPLPATHAPAVGARGLFLVKDGAAGRAQLVALRVKGLFAGGHVGIVEQRHDKGLCLDGSGSLTMSGGKIKRSF